jgi:hypothetical protein
MLVYATMNVVKIKIDPKRGHVVSLPAYNGTGLGTEKRTVKNLDEWWDALNEHRTLMAGGASDWIITARERGLFLVRRSDQQQQDVSRPAPLEAPVPAALPSEGLEQLEELQGFDANIGRPRTPSPPKPQSPPRVFDPDLHRPVAYRTKKIDLSTALIIRDVQGRDPVVQGYVTVPLWMTMDVAQKEQFVRTLQKNGPLNVRQLVRQMEIRLGKPTLAALETEIRDFKPSYIYEVAEKEVLKFEPAEAVQASFFLGIEPELRTQMSKLLRENRNLFNRFVALVRNRPARQRFGMSADTGMIVELRHEDAGPEYPNILISRTVKRPYFNRKTKSMILDLPVSLHGWIATEWDASLDQYGEQLQGPKPMGETQQPSVKILQILLRLNRVDHYHAALMYLLYRASKRSQILEQAIPWSVAVSNTAGALLGDWAVMMNERDGWTVAEDIFRRRPVRLSADQTELGSRLVYGLPAQMLSSCSAEELQRNPMPYSKNADGSVVTEKEYALRVFYGARYAQLSDAHSFDALWGMFSRLVHARTGYLWQEEGRVVVGAGGNLEMPSDRDDECAFSYYTYSDLVAEAKPSVVPDKREVKKFIKGMADANEDEDEDYEDLKTMLLEFAGKRQSRVQKLLEAMPSVSDMPEDLVDEISKARKKIKQEKAKLKRAKENADKPAKEKKPPKDPKAPKKPKVTDESKKPKRLTAAEKEQQKKEEERKALLRLLPEADLDDDEVVDDEIVDTIGLDNIIEDQKRYEEEMRKVQLEIRRREREEREENARKAREENERRRREAMVPLTTEEQARLYPPEEKVNQLLNRRLQKGKKK